MSTLAKVNPAVLPVEQTHPKEAQSTESSWSQTALSLTLACSLVRYAYPVAQTIAPLAAVPLKYAPTAFYEAAMTHSPLVFTATAMLALGRLLTRNTLALAALGAIGLANRASAAPGINYNFVGEVQLGTSDHLNPVPSITCTPDGTNCFSARIYDDGLLGAAGATGAIMTTNPTSVVSGTCPFHSATAYSEYSPRVMALSDTEFFTAYIEAPIAANKNPMISRFNTSCGEINGPAVQLSDSYDDIQVLRLETPDDRSEVGMLYLGKDVGQQMGADFGIAKTDASGWEFTPITLSTDLANPITSADVTAPSSGSASYSAVMTGTQGSNTGVHGCVVTKSGGVLNAGSLSLIVSDPNASHVRISSIPNSSGQSAVIYQTQEAGQDTIKWLIVDQSLAQVTSPAILDTSSSYEKVTPELVVDSYGNKRIVYIDSTNGNIMRASLDKYNRVLKAPIVLPGVPSAANSQTPDISLVSTTGVAISRAQDDGGNDKTLVATYNTPFLYGDPNAPTTLNVASVTAVPIPNQEITTNIPGVQAIYTFATGTDLTAIRLTAMTDGGIDSNYNAATGVYTTTNLGDLTKLKVYQNSASAVDVTLQRTVGSSPNPFLTESITLNLAAALSPPPPPSSPAVSPSPSKKGVNVALIGGATGGALALVILAVLFGVIVKYLLGKKSERNIKKDTAQQLAEFKTEVKQDQATILSAVSAKTNGGASTYASLTGGDAITNGLVGGDDTIV